MSCRFRSNNSTTKALFLHPHFGEGIDDHDTLRLVTASVTLGLEGVILAPALVKDRLDLRLSLICRFPRNGATFKLKFTMRWVG